jgi:hypothetical protein
VVYCHALSERVPPDIEACTSFVKAASLDEYEMKEIALTIDPRLGISDGAYR